MPTPTPTPCRVKLAPMAAEVVAMYAAEAPCPVWPELDALLAWDGDALVVTADNRDALADALITLCNYYDGKAEGTDPTSDGEPRRFCRAASQGLGGAWRRVLAVR